MLALGYDDGFLETAIGNWTATEIAQQPRTLAASYALACAVQTEIVAFAAAVLDDPNGRLILTGAGSSAFIGEILVPLLAGVASCHVEAIATTDIVAAPGIYLDPARSTLIISFARSGNSPESLAAVDLADQLLPSVRHIAVTCNADGQLAKRFGGRENGKVVILPDETHDRGFAMTSSLSAMTLAALTLLTGNRKQAPRAKCVIEMVQHTIDDHCATLREVAASGCTRVIYLGSGPFKGVAREAALKLLELTDGATVAVHDTPLGFRHGPKTIVDPQTLVVVFISNDEYTRSYDLDLLTELQSDGRARKVIAISGHTDTRTDSTQDILITGGDSASDAELVFPFLAVAQMLAFHQSLRLGVTPDNPSPAGLVNRVVQGVVIHPYSPAAVPG